MNKEDLLENNINQHSEIEQISDDILKSKNDDNHIETNSKDGKCHTCMGNKKFVYSIGSITARFPSRSIEKEYEQVVSMLSEKNGSDNKIFYDALKRHRYLAREMCWVFTIEGLDAFIILPKDPFQLESLIEENLNPINKTDDDTSVIIGELGPIAPPEYCNGLSLHTVILDNFYTFSKEKLIESLPNSKNDKEFRQSAKELFNRIHQIADNIGVNDSHRALNYISVRYPGIYNHTVKMNQEGYTLDRINVIPSRLSGVHKLVDPVFEFVDRTTGIRNKFYMRVDVTDKFPFIHAPLTQFFDRV